MAVLATAVDAAPVISSDVTVSREGYFVLRWEAAAPDNNLVLQQSTEPDFRSDVEQWPVDGALQFTLSGLEDDVYYYRLSSDSGVSNTISVQVEHHTLDRALLFFLLGAVLFSTLVIVLIIGDRRLKRTGTS